MKHATLAASLIFVTMFSDDSEMSFLLISYYQAAFAKSSWVRQQKNTCIKIQLFSSGNKKLNGNWVVIF